MRNFSRRPDGGTEKPKPVAFSKTLMRMGATLWRPELKKWRLRMAMAFTITLIAKMLSVAAPVYLGKAINQLTISQQSVESASLTAGKTFIVFMIIYGLARFFANALPQFRDGFFVRVTQNMNRVIAHEAFLHAQKQSLHFHLTKRAGALNRVIERGSGAMEFLLRFLVFNIGPTLIELVMAASLIAILYGPELSLFAVLTVILYIIFTIRVTEWRNRLRREMNNADIELKAITMDTFSNFETVKAFAAEDREANRFDRSFDSFTHHYVRSMKSMYLMNGGQEFIMSAGLLAIALAAGFGVQRGDMQVGDIMAVILMMTNIYRPLNILGFAWREINQSSVDVENLYDLLEEQPEIQDKEGANPISISGAAIEFDDVSFAYEGRESSLDHVSLSIKPGSFVGVVGPSGAGKSTLVKVLFRFYDPSTGKISIDGQDIAEVTQESLRSNLGLVPQDVTLFNDSLRMNVSYANPDASEEMISSALEKSQLSDFVKSLPDGLDTIVGERGLKLSGGERQRVGLARAILSDPRILILDEATSSLDSATEEEVQQALQEAARGRTTIAIAHRLSTIVAADEIIVLQEGKVSQIGTHTSLLADNGLYAELWNKQIAEQSDDEFRK